MVLKRMSDAEELDEKKDAEGKLVYQMRHPLRGSKLPSDHPARKLADGARFPKSRLSPTDSGRISSPVFKK
jgi:hypothetical protein